MILKFKIIHLNYYEEHGGAAQAAFRLHNELLSHNISSEYWAVVKSSSSEKTIQVKIKHRLFWQRVSAAICRLQLSSNKAPKSLGVFSSGIIEKINQSDADIVHFHWINGEMLSIKEVSKITKPVEWTFHDTWPICGTEHYFNMGDSATDRYLHGYLNSNKEDIGLDVDKYVWNLKRRHWSDFYPYIVTPSKWLRDLVNKSKLFQNRNIAFIPNGINTNEWKALDKSKARDCFGINLSSKVVSMGAMTMDNEIKGGKLLRSIMDKLLQDKSCSDIVFLVSGAGESKYINENATVVRTGLLRTNEQMRQFYNVADLFILPSLIDNLPNMLMEAMACGTPCVGFNTGGVPEMIDHKKNGYVAESFNVDDFVNGMKWVLFNSNYQDLSMAARHKVETEYDIINTVKQYLNLYQSILSH